MLNTSLHTDKELFLRISEGDEEVFKTFFRRYVLQLRPFVFSMDNSERLVDEVIQETMIKVWLNRDKLAAIEDPKAWICRVAANQYYTLRKRWLLDKKATGRLYEESSKQHNEVSETVDLNSLKAAIQRGVNLLPAQRKKIYLLRREEGLTIPEIANQLGLSANTVRNTLANASEFIREYLAKQGYTTATLLLFLSAL